MKCRVRTFGIACEMMGGREVEIEFPGSSVADLKSYLIVRYPEMAGLRSLFIAINQQYAPDSAPITEADEVALIPPVSGG